MTIFVVTEVQWRDIVDVDREESKSKVYEWTWSGVSNIFVSVSVFESIEVVEVERC